MGNWGYKRVSRKRICLICGKPDWCSYTPDEKISFCARVIENASRVSRHGWGVFYHEKSASTGAASRVPFPFESRLRKQVEPLIAPLAVRDFAYRKLIELSPAAASKEITDGDKGLRARKILDFESYGSLPQKSRDRNKIAKHIRGLINQNFPDYVRKQKSSISGLPGFWLDENGRARLWADKNYSYPLMLIPYRDSNGAIQACQIRFMSASGSIEQNPRYVWLSTPRKSSGGISSGSPLHFAGSGWSPFSPDKPIIVTEGALKAETALKFKSGFNVIASGGVTSAHVEIIAAARRRPLFIAYDNDFRENRHVARAVARLLGLRLDDSEKYNYNPQVKILAWDTGVKGFDDALLQGISIAEQTPGEWLQSLSRDCCREIENFFQSSLPHI